MSRQISLFAVTETPPALNLRAQPPPGGWGVEVANDAVGRLLEAWEHHRFGPPRFDYEGLPQIEGEAWLTFCVLAVSVIACLWPPEGEEMWSVELDGTWLDDAPGVFGCFTRATAWHPEHFARFDETAASEFFAGRGHLQLVAERGERLRAVARALLSDWNGSGINLVAHAGWDGPTTVELLIEQVPGFRDRVRSEVGELRFDKLAHLCVAMMSARSPQPIRRLHTFGVYPDYMLPRILRALGVLRYEPGLATAVDTRQIIAEHSRWELAIRWATVYAADQIRAGLNRRGNPVTSPELDYHLWWSAVLGPDADELGEHHRTITMAY